MGSVSQLLLGLGAGFSVGLLFSWLRLPLPAPPTLVGISGALGVCLGGMLFQQLARLAGH